MLRWIMANKAPERWRLNPSSRQTLELGEMRGQEGLSYAARQALLALSRGELSPDETRMVIEAINRLGEHEERTILAAQVDALEADPVKLLEHKRE